MSIVKNLLVELFVEELPPKALKLLGEAFTSNLVAALQAQGLLNASSRATSYATPRRLATHIAAVADKASDKTMQQKLMPVSVALDNNDQPTPALLKKLATMGMDATVVPNLKRQLDGKAEALFLDTVVSGATLTMGLNKALEDTLNKLPIPKVMSYQLADGWTTVKFVRPAHGLIALHGSDVVPISILGLNAGNTTQGHRFEASSNSILIKNADSYESQLEQEGAVIASFAARRASIVEQLHTAATKLNLNFVESNDEALLDEVTSLVERPNVLACQFEEKFLSVPSECLILTMKTNQKYFPLWTATGALTNKFLVVSNISPKDPSKVIEGNERVVRPRLADAKFFYEQDRKKPLEAHLNGLKKVVYHNKLGSIFDKANRIKQLAAHLHSQLPVFSTTNLALVEEAAMLCKCDLLTTMVGEFPELQGIMGRYYAEADGLDAQVFASMNEHYMPRGAGDLLPQTPVGILLAIADKLDTIIGVFAIDQKPTGAKDPFALRRAAIGVLRIIIENKLAVDLLKVINFAVSIQPIKAANDTVAEVYEYIMERLRGLYLEGSELGRVTTEMFDAVLANRPASPLDFHQRLHALQSFLKLSDAQSLAAANKRISNILKKVDGAISGEVTKKLLEETAENELYIQLQSAEADTAPMFATHNYHDALTRLAVLRPAVDQFFDGVMVMTEDLKVRNNRLALLARLRNVFLQVADLSRLPG